MSPVEGQAEKSPAEGRPLGSPPQRFPRRKAVFALLLVVLWGAFLALAGELHFRLRDFRVGRTNPYVQKSEALTAMLQREFDQSLWEVRWWKYRPRAAVKISNELIDLSISTNALGLRGPEVRLPKPAGVYRLVCVGGSTTFEGVADDKTYPALLERKLREHFGTDRIEVINCGVSGLDSGGERRKLPDYLALEPDLLLEYNGANDICLAMFPRFREEANLGQKLLRRSRLVETLWNRCLQPPEGEIKERYLGQVMANLQALIDAARAGRRAIVFSTFCRPEPSLLSREQQQFLEYDLCHTWGGGANFVTFATYCRLIDLYNRELEQMCRRRGVPCLPVAVNFAGQSSHFVDICHLDPQGIEEKAEIIFQGLVPHIEGAVRASVAAGR
jgi:hypothetical protein